MNGLPRLLGDDLEIGLPHVTADEPQRRATLRAQPVEERQQRLYRTLLPHPQKPLAVGVDLIDHGQVSMTPSTGCLPSAQGISSTRCG